MHSQSCSSMHDMLCDKLFSDPLRQVSSAPSYATDRICRVWSTSHDEANRPQHFEIVFALEANCLWPALTGAGVPSLAIGISRVCEWLRSEWAARPHHRHRYIPKTESAAEPVELPSLHFNSPPSAGLVALAPARAAERVTSGTRRWRDIFGPA